MTGKCGMNLNVLSCRFVLKRQHEKNYSACQVSRLSCNAKAQRKLRSMKEHSNWMTIVRKMIVRMTNVRMMMTKAKSTP